MKKILSALVFVIFAGIFNFCSADPYSNNPNYIEVTAGQMGVYYLYRPSVGVQEYNPPHYQISGHFIHYSDFGTTDIYTTLRYNWYTKETFTYDSGYWKKAEVMETKSGMAAIRNRRFADALFRAAYGMDFYGY